MLLVNGVCVSVDKCFEYDAMLLVNGVCCCG